jgi:hypothetical protein
MEVSFIITQVNTLFTLIRQQRLPRRGLWQLVATKKAPRSNKIGGRFETFEQFVYLILQFILRPR